MPSDSAANSDSKWREKMSVTHRFGRYFQKHYTDSESPFSNQSTISTSKPNEGSSLRFNLQDIISDTVDKHPNMFPFQIHKFPRILDIHTEGDSDVSTVGVDSEKNGLSGNGLLGNGSLLFNGSIGSNGASLGNGGSLNGSKNGLQKEQEKITSGPEEAKGVINGNGTNVATETINGTNKSNGDVNESDKGRVNGVTDSGSEGESSASAGANTTDDTKGSGEDITDKKPIPALNTKQRDYLSKKMDELQDFRRKMRYAELEDQENAMINDMNSQTPVPTDITTLKKPAGSQKVPEEGFSLYGTKDEEGLHVYEGDEEEYTDDQDDYDIDELEDDLYDGPTEHHIELELQPECEIHGAEDCDCPVYDDEFNEEETYDFTFEYNNEGRLVPTADSVKEYFRARVNGLGKDGKYNSDKVTEISSTKKRNKKKHKKPAKVAKPLVFDPESTDQCLFCDFEALYGYKPKNLIKWVDKKLAQQEEKRSNRKKNKKWPDQPPKSQTGEDQIEA